MLTLGPNLGLLINGDIGEEHYAHLMKQWRVLDGVVQASILSVGALLPPTINVDGDQHIVGVGATGPWAGRDGCIARYYTIGDGSPAWEFITPKPGWEVRNRGDLDGQKPIKMVYCEDDVWRTDLGSGGGAAETVVTIADTTYQLSAEHANSYIRLTATTAKTVEVRAEIDHPLPQNGYWNIRNVGAGDATITSTATVNVPSGGSLVIPPDGLVTLKRIADNVFDLSGNTISTAPPGGVNTVNGKTGPDVTLVPGDIGAATSAQGALADTAVQPAALATAISGKENSSNKVQDLSAPSSTTYLSTQGLVVALAAVSSGLTPKGEWNSSTNTPTLVSSTGTAGHYYVVSVASSGVTTLDGISVWGLGDKVIFSGGVWIKEPNYQAVTNVNGQTGVVTITAANISAAPASHVGATGAAHGNVTTSVAGFASPADKIKIDGAAPTVSPTFTVSVVLPANTTVGAVTAAQLSYLGAVTSDIQAQINAKATLNAPTFQSAVTVNAAIGQSSIYFSQAGVNNGRIYGGGGGGTDVIIDSGRFVTMNPMTNFKVSFNGVVGYDLSATAFTLPAGSKITGDFSNTTNSSRVMVQTSTPNSVTRFDAIPSGSSTTATIGAFNSSDANNAAWARLTATATDVRVESTVSGSGTAVPLVLYSGGSAKVSIPATGDITTTVGLKIAVSANTNLTLDKAGGASIQFARSGVNGYQIDDNSGTLRFLANGNSSTVTFSISASGNAILSGNFNFSGVATGNGSGLTNLPAANLTGTVADARLPASQTGKTFTSGVSLSYTAPVIVMRDTSSASVNTLSYISLQNSTGSEVGWMGYGAGNGEMGFNNSNRNIRFLSPIVTSSTLTTGAKLQVRFDAGNSPIYDSGHLELVGTNGNAVVMGFKSESFTACSLVHKSGGNGLELQGTTFNSLANFKAAVITATAGLNVTGETFSSRFISGLASTTAVLDNGFRVTDGATYNYGMCVPSNTGGLDFHSDQSGANSFRWYSGSFASPTLKMALQQSGNLELLTGNYIGNGSGLTNLNASALTTGTVHQDRFPKGLAYSATVDTFVLRDGSANITANTFIGSGASLTNLPAGNLTGTIADARLSSNVALVSNVVTRETPEQLFQALGTVSGAVTINAANGTHVLATVNAATTWTLPAPGSTMARAITLELTNGGAYSMTWPSLTRWAGGTAPILTSAGTDVIVFTKAGTNNWRGYLSSKDSK